MSIQWLEFEAFKNKIEIRHALNHGEEQFGPYYVDGFCDWDKVQYALHMSLPVVFGMIVQSAVQYWA